MAVAFFVGFAATALVGVLGFLTAAGVFTAAVLGHMAAAARATSVAENIYL